MGFYKRQKVEIPPPTVEDDIYVPYAIYCGRSQGVGTGGLAKVRKVILIDDGSDHVVYFEKIEIVFYWDSISHEQEALKKMYGEKRAGTEQAHAQMI